MLAQRIATALVLLALCLFALWWAPPWVWLALVALLGFVAAQEWSRLIRASTVQSVSLCAAVTLTAAAPGLGAPLPWLAALWALAALMWGLVVPALLARGTPLRKGGVVLAWLVLGPMAAALVWLGRMPDLLLALMAVVWIADTGAYFVGRRFGRHKLAPTVSPGKSWEGVAGGVLAVGLYVLALQWTAIGAGGPLAGAAGAVLALALTALSVQGDLFESMLKRQAGAKDSGTLLPGHGGVLDRVDGLTATLPVAALAVYFS